MTNENKVHKKRGIFLTIVIILDLLSSIITLPTLFSPTITQKMHPTYPSWYNTQLFFVIILDFIALYGLWKWKKWGVYLFILELLISITVPLILFDMQSFIEVLIISAIFFFPVYRKWQYFE